MVERLYSYFFISDKVHVYSGEGQKMAAQHVMNDIDQPTMLEYILASMRTRLCVLPSRLYQSAAGWRFCRLLRSVNYHMLATCQEHSKKFPFTFHFQKEKILSCMNFPVCFEQLACPILLLFDTLT